MDATLKLTTEQYENLWVTSDLHMHHNKDFIYGKRGYSSAEEMTSDIIAKINKTVGESGILMSLGDFCLNTTPEMYLDILRRLRIKELILLKGNHPNPMNRIHPYGEHRVEGVSFPIRNLGDYFTMRYGSKFFVCFHFPIAVFDGMSHGSMCLVGHSHGGYRLSRPEDKTYKILDCGWDIFRAPIHIKEIVEIMATKGVNSLHHDK